MHEHTNNPATARDFELRALFVTAYLLNTRRNEARHTPRHQRPIPSLTINGKTLWSTEYSVTCSCIVRNVESESELLPALS